MDVRILRTGSESKPTTGALTTGKAPGALPLVGHAHRLRKDPLGFLASLPAHADLVEIRLGRQPAFVACHPELVHRILMDPRTFDKGGPLFDKARPLIGNGLVSCKWEDHRWQRRTLQPAFHPDRIDGYATAMHEEAEALVSAWQAGQVLDVGHITHAMTMRALTRTMFAIEAGDRAVAEVQRCLPVVLDGIYRRTVAPTGIWYRLPTPGNRRYAHAQRRLWQIIDDIIREHRRTRTGSDGLLATLLGARDHRTGEPLGDRDIRDQVMSFLLAGTETAAATLAFTLYLLGRHPDAERRVHAEVDDVTGSGPSRMADPARLGYTQRVISEALRLYAPTWIVTRTTTAATELAGLRLPPNTTVIHSPHLVHRHPGLFPDPERFDPDRWLPERAQALPRGAVIPFGMGNRKCIGDQFALTEITLALAAITARWRLRPVPGTSLCPQPKATLGTGPLPMILEHRGSCRPGAGGE